MYSFSHFFLLQTFSCSTSFKLCSASPFSSFPLPISPSSTSSNSSSHPSPFSLSHNSSSLLFLLFLLLLFVFFFSHPLLSPLNLPFLFPTSPLLPPSSFSKLLPIPRETDQTDQSLYFLLFFQVMGMLDPQTIDMFYFSGSKYTTPNCPVDMAPNFNPSSGAQSYLRSTKDCIRNSRYRIPFFLDRPGPLYEEWTVNAHEARPGHHTQVADVEYSNLGSTKIHMTQMGLTWAM